jgi:hypothetical protein
MEHLILDALRHLNVELDYLVITILNYVALVTELYHLEILSFINVLETVLLLTMEIIILLYVY